MLLRTQRLELEPVRQSHAAEVWRQLDDDRMWRYFPQLRPAAQDDLRRLYEKWERGSPHANQVWYNWVCRDRASGEIVGSVQATIFAGERAAYIAYATYPAHQRKAYAREAVAEAMRYVRESLNVERFYAEMDTRNEASYRLAESLGFRRVETRGAVESGGPNEYVYELTVQ